MLLVRLFQLCPLGIFLRRMSIPLCRCQGPLGRNPRNRNYTKLLVLVSLTLQMIIERMVKSLMILATRILEWNMHGRFAPGGPLPSVHAAVKSELFLPSLAPGGPDMTPRPIAGPYQTVAVPPPLENKQSLSVDVFKVVASLEAMELLRRHCQIERERRQQWRAITCNEIFIWWRSIIISLPVPLLPQDRVRIQNGSSTISWLKLRTSWVHFILQRRSVVTTCVTKLHLTA